MFKEQPRQPEAISNSSCITQGARLASPDNKSPVSRVTFKTTPTQNPTCNFHIFSPFQVISGSAVYKEKRFFPDRGAAPPLDAIKLVYLGVGD